MIQVVFGSTDYRGGKDTSKGKEKEKLRSEKFIMGDHSGILQ